MSNTIPRIGLLATCLLVACSNQRDEQNSPDLNGNSGPQEQAADDDYTEPEGLPGVGSGACDYVNPFSELSECKQYSGVDWTDEKAAEDCAAVIGGTVGVFRSGGKCRVSPNSGACVVTTDPGLSYYILQGGSAELCVTLISACETFVGGTFVSTPNGVCDEGESTEEILIPAESDLQEEALIAMQSSSMVTVSPECLDLACMVEIKADNDYITFLPKSAATNVGVIFYPGGNLDARAYAAATHAFAAEGFTSFLVPMPGDLAFNGIDIAFEVIEGNPELSKWVLVGHSLGGVVSAKFALRNPGVLDGLALWATYMDNGDDLSVYDIPASSIFGSLDPLATKDLVLADQPQMPPSTEYVNIRGGNHSYFMWAGLRSGDVESTLISQKQQTTLAAESTLHLLRRVEAGESFVPDSGYEEAALRDEELGCAEVQALIANIDLPLEKIELEHREDFREFGSFSETVASVTPDEASWIKVYQYTKQAGNPRDLRAPALIGGELFCKLKSQNAIIQGLNESTMSVSGPQKPCGAYSAHVLDWAIEYLPQQMRVEARRWNVLVSDDHRFDIGPDFMVGDDSFVSVSRDTSSMTLALRSPVYHSPEDSEFDTGNVYCKVLSHERALMLAYELGRELY